MSHHQCNHPAKKPSSSYLLFFYHSSLVLCVPFTARVDFNLMTDCVVAFRENKHFTFQYKASEGENF